MSFDVHVPGLDHIKGAADASVTLLEYGDYECSYCGAANSVVNQLLGDLDGRLKYVFRHFPLTEIHPQAEDAAEVAELAAKHGKFWKMHNALYENQASLGAALYIELGHSLGISEDEVIAAVEGHTFVPRIKENYDSGIRDGVDGTPAFFIDGRRYAASYDYAELRAAIEASVE